MPQTDFHRKRLIPIEFDFNENFKNLPYENRLSLILITNGNATLTINKKIFLLNAPCVFCISKYDEIKLINAQDLCAKSFCFDPAFIKAVLSFENLNDAIKIDTKQEHNRDLLFMFVDHYDNFQGIFELTPNTYMRLNETLSIIGAETFSQSDKYWTCRIRRLLLQALNTVFDVYVDQRKLNFFEKSEKKCVDLCIEYIHANYQEDIRLEDLCQLSNLNRTSLSNRFKQKLDCTAMEYLVNYRIKIASEALAHTNLKLSEIAEACGFKYDTYFIKQFTKKMSISPTEYRQNIWKLT